MLGFHRWLWRVGAALCCSAQTYCGGFSCCGARTLGTRASVVVACRLSSCGSWALEHRLSSCGARASLLHGMWDHPWPGLEPLSSALAGRFLATVPPGKSLFLSNLYAFCLLSCWLWGLFTQYQRRLVKTNILTFS